MIPTTIPHGHTARRLEWSFLPVHLRAEVEQRLGAAVRTADSQDAGFTPGMASVLTCVDGSRHFVKAASLKAQRPFAEAYREEGRKLSALPAAAPAPALRWTIDDGDWVVLGLEHVAARAPHRPWRAEDLTAAVAMLERLADELTPAPEELELTTFADDLAAFPGFWEAVPGLYPELPAAQVAQAAALAGGFREVTAGTTLVHTDVRDDNILLAEDGRALLCDWNWPALGAPWLDTVILMIGPRGDGLDVASVLAASALTHEVAPDDVDVLLALVTGYFLHQACLPAPPTSPHLREVQAWQGAVCWDWLGERRGWQPRVAPRR